MKKVHYKILYIFHIYLAFGHCHKWTQTIQGDPPLCLSIYVVNFNIFYMKIFYSSCRFNIFITDCENMNGV